jgi:hypothetical protein
MFYEMMQRDAKLTTALYALPSPMSYSIGFLRSTNDSLSRLSKLLSDDVAPPPLSLLPSDNPLAYNTITTPA